jgi:hypothetical protein
MFVDLEEHISRVVMIPIEYNKKGGTCRGKMNQSIFRENVGIESTISISFSNTPLSVCRSAIERREVEVR